VGRPKDLRAPGSPSNSSPRGSSTLALDGHSPQLTGAPPGAKDGWFSFATCGALALLAVAVRVAIGPKTVDDAYITFRYARNLSEGLGLVYNAGQQVLGTSTPLYTLLLAAIRAATRGDLSWIALVINAAADAVSTLLLFRLGQRLLLPRWSSTSLALAWALYPIAVRYSVGGMETSLESALWLGAAILYLQERDLWAMALLALSILTRPDSLSAALAIGLGIAVTGRRIPAKELLAMLLVLLPWVAWSWWRYGSFIPQSLLAKSGLIYRIDPLENLRQVAYFIAGVFAAGPMGVAARGIYVSLPVLSGVCVALFGYSLVLLWASGLNQVARGLDQRVLWILAIPAIHYGAYAGLGLLQKPIAEWYLLAPLPFFLAGLAITVNRISQAGQSSILQGLPLLFGALLVLCQMMSYRPTGQGCPGCLTSNVIWTERETLYREAGELLRTRVGPRDVVAASEIGALGYYCDCRILDTVGLVTPEAAKYYPLPPSDYASNYAIPAELVQELSPAYLVTLDVFIRKSLEGQGWFTGSYHPIWQVATTAFGSESMIVFQRNAQEP